MAAEGKMAAKAADGANSKKKARGANFTKAEDVWLATAVAETTLDTRGPSFGSQKPAAGSHAPTVRSWRLRSQRQPLINTQSVRGVSGGSSTLSSTHGPFLASQEAAAGSCPPTVHSWRLRSQRQALIHTRSVLGVSEASGRLSSTHGPFFLFLAAKIRGVERLSYLL